MRALSIQTIIHLLPEPCRKIIIGYSGGIDSHALLHLCASRAEIKDKVLAVYIHHGLQKEADLWGAHCRVQCVNLGVEFNMIKVDAKPKPGESPEAAARNARYAAFKGLLEAGDVLLLAQHREDQMETMLLQLFRGGGIHGLAAMPPSVAFGYGLALRPFLNVSKIEIQCYAASHGLVWIDDPSNLRDDFDRNFLRNQVVPLLKQRWPSLDKTVARSAQHCGDAARILDEWVETALKSVFDRRDLSLSIEEWRQFEEHQKKWLLRRWLQELGLKPCSQAVLQAIVDQLIYADDAANPQILIQGVQIRKYRQQLFCVAGDYLHKEARDIQWNQRDPSLLMANGYRLTRIESFSGIDKRLWDKAEITVTSRRGGEKIKIPGRQGRHCLKKLYQEAGIPPWEREVRPLVYLNGRLAAVAGLWVDEWAWSEQGNCYGFLWQP